MHGTSKTTPYPLLSGSFSSLYLVILLMCGFLKLKAFLTLRFSNNSLSLFGQTLDLQASLSEKQDQVGLRIGLSRGDVGCIYKNCLLLRMCFGANLKYVNSRALQEGLRTSETTSMVHYVIH